jgi:cyanophycinase
MRNPFNMKHIFGTVLLVLFATSLCAQTPEGHLTHGPRKGTLIAIGGGGNDLLIMKEFGKYAGGDDARIVVIPTALSDDDMQEDSSFSEIKRSLELAGMKGVTILHTRDTARANDEEFIAPLKTATGLFFSGGRQWRIADGFLHTRAHEEMFSLLDRGGVIAGTSAGATIQGSYLARGDTRNNQIMMGDHESGLSFITHIAIDQHVLARNRQFDMFDILKNRPELLGVGIDENTAIVVQADTLEVIGKSYVLLYDGSFWSREGSDLKHLPEDDALFYFLRAGDRYDLAERKIME